MKLALAQISASPDQTSNMSRCLEIIERAADEGAELIAFPELAATRFFPQHPDAEWAKDAAELVPGQSTEQIQELAQRHRVVVVFNLYERDVQGRYFDSSPVIDADGALLGATRMVHITDYPCFHERAYYHPGDRGAPVYQTEVGRIGVAICYDRHYPEYMRALGVGKAELVIIPQAGSLDEWPEGMYEAEVRAAAFQNGYFVALCNRVGEEDRLTFSGESFVAAPDGAVIARGKRLEEDLVLVDLALSECESSPARRLFWPDRRPNLYGRWLG